VRTETCARNVTLLLYVYQPCTLACTSTQRPSSTPCKHVFQPSLFVRPCLPGRAPSDPPIPELPSWSARRSSRADDRSLLPCFPLPPSLSLLIVYSHRSRRRSPTFSNRNSPRRSYSLLFPLSAALTLLPLRSRPFVFLRRPDLPLFSFGP
jgi:hypothetical protein